MQIFLSRIKTLVTLNHQLKQNIISNDSNDSMYCSNRTCNVSLVDMQNQIDAAAAYVASALLFYMRDARHAEALVPTWHKRMLAVTWLNKANFTHLCLRIHGSCRWLIAGAASIVGRVISIG